MSGAAGTSLRLSRHASVPIASATALEVIIACQPAPTTPKRCISHGSSGSKVSEQAMLAPTDIPGRPSATSAAPATGATRVVAQPPAGQQTSEQPAIVAVRVPRPARAGAAAGRPPAPPARSAMSARGAAPARVDGQRRGGAVKRLLLGLLIVGLLLAGGAAAVISTMPGPRGVTTRKVTLDKVDGIVQQLVQLVNDNTR